MNMQYEELVLFKISPATNHFRSGLGLDNYTFILILVRGQVNDRSVGFGLDYFTDRSHKLHTVTDEELSRSGLWHWAM